jgi:hypothetical protein
MARDEVEVGHGVIDTLDPITRADALDQRQEKALSTQAARDEAQLARGPMKHDVMKC